MRITILTYYDRRHGGLIPEGVSVYKSTVSTYVRIKHRDNMLVVRIHDTNPEMNYIVEKVAFPDTPLIWLD